MMRRRIVIAMIFTGLVLISCHKVTEEDRIRNVISTIQKAAEGKEIKTILDRVSRSYHDPQGNDYDAIKGILAYYLFQHQKVSVTIPDLEVSVNGAAAKAVFSAILTGRATGASPAAIIPEALGVYTFDVTLAREKDEWKVVAAVWKQTGTGVQGGQ